MAPNVFIRQSIAPYKGITQHGYPENALWLIRSMISISKLELIQLSVLLVALVGTFIQFPCIPFVITEQPCTYCGCYAYREGKDDNFKYRLAFSIESGHQYAMVTISCKNTNSV